MYSKEYVRFITDFQNEHCPKSYVTVHLLKTHTQIIYLTLQMQNVHLLKYSTPI